MNEFQVASVGLQSSPFPFDKLRVPVHPFVELVETNIPERSPQNNVPEDDVGHCTSYFESFTYQFKSARYCGMVTTNSLPFLFSEVKSILPLRRVTKNFMSASPNPLELSPAVGVAERRLNF